MLHTFIKHMEENGWQVALYENRNDYNRLVLMRE